MEPMNFFPAPFSLGTSDMTVTDVLPAHVDVCPQNVEKSIVSCQIGNVLYSSKLKSPLRDSKNEMKEFNANKQIKRLKEELDISKLQTEQMRQDFEAYKIYTKELLDNERRLNKELRKSYH
ncbi:unnamed protein product [Schistosoma intercalatum]|nr:unnamed protein product [Schistosoma intercalatum]